MTATWQNQALDHATDEYAVDLSAHEQTPGTIMDVLSDGIAGLKDTIEKEVEQKLGIKVIVTLVATFHQAADPTFLTEPPAVFNTDPVAVFAATDINEVLVEVTKNMSIKIDVYEQRGSGWVLHELLHIDLHVYDHDPLRGSTYVVLLKEIADKHAVVNIKNNDDKCFIWGVVAAIFGDENQRNP